MNVIEIDAASNNGVDNIRQIREEVTYRPTEGKYKVYIIDEVHMLSAGAFNALLKTLEEPPSYVMFILATTEAHKIPITILSRCQRYDFHRISIETIADRLSELMSAEKVEVEERALRYVAKAGDGSMRDALSLLDQCIAFHLGQKLTYEDVLEVLGAVDTEVFSRLLRQILSKNIVEAIATVDELVDEGRELGQLVSDFTWYLRNLLLIQSSDEMEEVLDMSAENLAALKEESKMISAGTLIRYINIFSELGNQIRYSANKRILLEIAIIRLCRPQMEQDYASLTERVDVLEDKLEHGAVVQALPHSGDTASAAQNVPAQKPKFPEAIPDDIRQLIRNWKSIISEMGGISRQYLNKAVPTLGASGELLLVFDDINAYNYLNDDRAGGITKLEERIASRIEKEISVKLQFNESGRRAGESVPDLREMIDFDIDQEEI
jgi:DNA polymerase-3 subunit gamma/tau